MSLRRTFFDTMAMSLVSLMRLLAQFVAIPILSRILLPEDYGVVAMIDIAALLSALLQWPWLKREIALCGDALSQYKPKAA